MIQVLSSKWASVVYELTWRIGLHMDLGKFIKNTQNLSLESKGPNPWADGILSLDLLVKLADFGAQWAP